MEACRQKKREAKVTIMGVRVKRQCFTGGECVHMKKKSLFLALEKNLHWAIGICGDPQKGGNVFFFFKNKLINSMSYSSCSIMVVLWVIYQVWLRFLIFYVYLTVPKNIGLYLLVGEWPFAWMRLCWQRRCRWCIRPSICQFHVTRFIKFPVLDKCACLCHARLGSISFACGIEEDSWWLIFRQHESSRS